MNKKHQALAVRVGDVVIIDLDHYPKNEKGRHNFPAKIAMVRERLGSSPLVEYERLDGIEEEHQHCDVHFVKRIIERHPYVCVAQPRENVFAGPYFFRNEKRGGIRIGTIVSLITEALAGATRVDLKYPLHETRAAQLYKRAGSPGRTIMPAHSREWWGYGNLAVNWKVFERWVHRNAQRLVMSKSEVVADAISAEKEMAEQYWRDFEDDMGRMDEEFDRDRLYLTPDDFSPEYDYM